MSTSGPEPATAAPPVPVPVEPVPVEPVPVEPVPVEPVPVEYVIGHVQEALGADGRVGEWGLHVVITGDVLTVLGTVTTTTRKSAVEAVANEALSTLGCSYEVRDHTEVAAAGSPVGEEELS